MSEYRVRQGICLTSTATQAFIQLYSSRVHVKRPQNIGLLHTTTIRRKAGQSRGGKVRNTTTWNAVLPIRHTNVPIKPGQESSNLHLLPKLQTSNRGRIQKQVPEKERVYEIITETKVISTDTKTTPKHQHKPSTEARTTSLKQPTHTTSALHGGVF